MEKLCLFLRMKNVLFSNTVKCSGMVNFNFEYEKYAVFKYKTCSTFKYKNRSLFKYKTFSSFKCK